jgi:hypothetical protein
MEEKRVDATSENITVVAYSNTARGEEGRDGSNRNVRKETSLRQRPGLIFPWTQSNTILKNMRCNLQLPVVGL